MVWNLIQSPFERIQPFMNWSFQGGVIAEIPKTAQKTNSHAETLQKLIRFHIVRLVFSVRVAPNLEVYSLYKYPLAPL